MDEVIDWSWRKPRLQNGENVVFVRERERRSIFFEVKLHEIPGVMAEQNLGAVPFDVEDVLWYTGFWIYVPRWDQATIDRKAEMTIFSK